MGRWRRAWQGLTGLPPEDERAEGRRRAREQQLRRLRRLRVWRRWLQRLRWIEPGGLPLTVLRWLAVLGITLAWWAQGAVTSPLKGWVPYVVIVGALILPDVAGFAVGGFKLDLKQAQDDIATLRQEVNAQARASSTSIVAIGDSTFAVLAQQIARAAAQVSGGQATGADTPWQDPDAVDA
jgi:hypothetical protein